MLAVLPDACRSLDPDDFRSKVLGDAFDERFVEVDKAGVGLQECDCFLGAADGVDV
jgi:hypothetical protein